MVRCCSCYGGFRWLCVCLSLSLYVSVTEKTMTMTMLAADGDDPAVSALRKCAKSLIKYFTNNGETTPPTSFTWNYRVGSPKATRPYRYSPLLLIRVLRCCTGSMMPSESVGDCGHGGVWKGERGRPRHLVREPAASFLNRCAPSLVPSTLAA